MFDLAQAKIASSNIPVMHLSNDSPSSWWHLALWKTACYWASASPSPWCTRCRPCPGPWKPALLELSSQSEREANLFNHVFCCCWKCSPQIQFHPGFCRMFSESNLNFGVFCELCKILVYKICKFSKLWCIEENIKKVLSKVWKIYPFFAGLEFQTRFSKF